MESRRSGAQNRMLWLYLNQIADQLPWSVNGALQWISAEDFKDVLSSALFREQRLAEGISGGLVMLGLRTSKMTKEQMNDLITFIEVFAIERGVKLSAEQGYEDFPEAQNGKM